MKKLGKESLENIVRGACLLGSGGGGGYDVSMQFIENFSEGEIAIDSASIDDLRNLTEKKCGVVVAYMGSPEKMRNVKHVDAAVNAVQRLSQEKLGSEGQIDYIIPVEIGPISSTVACLVAGELNIPVVDADGAGRAVPTLDLISYSGQISVNPTILSSEKDEKGKYHDVILQISEGDSEGSATKMESLARPILSMPEYNQRAGLAMWFFPDITEITKEGMCVPGTLTLCEELGEVIKLEQESDQPNTQAIIDFFEDYDSERCVKEICSGTLINATTTTAGGFDHGIITIQNTKDTYKIIFQNESLIIWDSSSPTPLAMAPDLIAFQIIEKEETDSVSEEGGKERYRWVYTNEDIMEDKQLKAKFKEAHITVIGLQAPKELIKTEQKVGVKRTEMLMKYNHIQNNTVSTLPEHYMSILNDLGYYGVYVPLQD
ncbi:DUF917 family protein [Bacteroides sp. 51]|uniref:S-methyl thiohydantoin desulfurase domain-containing protein n=1 Tax=Bacteroides sp. 51 TaxID=2302938 RepID=UPI0013D02DE1|nr:DUF917 family protein [Bacteroides sp. 51]NDV84607.1 DUF917 family protein [Bacteroides sp. 51]